MEHLDVLGGALLPRQFGGLQAVQGLRHARTSFGFGVDEVADQGPEALGYSLGSRGGGVDAEIARASSREHCGAHHAGRKHVHRGGHIPEIL